MTDWRSPHTLASTFLTLVKFVHVLDGLYIWEYVTTFQMEWEVISRQRPWRWSYLLYFGCRLATLAAVSTELAGFNITTQFDCRGWLTTLLVFSYLGFALDSLLIVSRSVAIWKHRTDVAILLFGVWMTNVAFLIYGITQVDADWDPESDACAILRTSRNRANVLATLLTDVVLLVVMFVGILQMPSDTSLWKLLHRHGIVWIALATIAEVPPTTFLFLNLNDAMNLMFQTPALVVMTIGATRIFRSLHQFGKPIVISASYLSNLPTAASGNEGSVIVIEGKPGDAAGTFKSSASAGSLAVEFPTSYGRYRAEDLYPLNAIDEEGTETEAGTSGVRSMEGE
ncbi:hypothetical protein BV25DRAFT_1915285 [Artomyces pyxidatus]|uniref:Uncharacterized protein n=1 Tax=Artomyces pyxidatus TaxID=48021 RepID=A0ACB8T630_9AGAM|nr:hypothetical protein BV25DRAFT_1915285 [Artomyces pyxidatus]